MLSGTEIRRRFLAFFEERGHRIVPSSSLVPHGDPTLLFTNAGMNQFKDVFLGLEQRDYKRATTAQKCVRAGGKHNDLENVGFTHRHHTFFEMLGNFSFGDYFKDLAIPLAWELLTSEHGYALPPARLYATVYTEDDQAESIWRHSVGLPADRVFRLGAADNFWAMGDTGPCGPCSELHYDQGPAASELGHADCRFPCDCGRYVEVWNLVFMQFERSAGGEMTPLPRPSIDTGAGLERLTAVLQGKLSNYDTDLFQPLIAAAATRAGSTYGASPRGDVSLRILADHARAATFLVHDGVTPGNEGRGYVLRKIVRRALRHARSLGVETAILPDLAGVVADQMAAAYPDLESSRQRVATVLRAEEERFAHTLALALRELDRVAVRYADGRTIPAGSLATRTIGEQVADGQKPELAGMDAFRLYDTFGLPLDLLREIASERGMALDEAGFEAAMEEQRRRARRSWKGADQGSAAGVHRDLASQARTAFEGYDATVVPTAHLRALLRDGQLVAAAATGDELDAVLDHTPFYAASGGQIGDRGVWTTPSGLAAEVLDTYAPVAGLILHRIRARQPLTVGQTLEAEVDVARRDATRRNHTATHLLHAALRQLLGTHVKQAGSVVEPVRLRFDFTHYAPLTPEQLEEIERVVNAQILRNLPVDTEIMPLDRALSTGAMALFGEKYQENVRVVSVPGFSQELCGGTHTRRTGDIGLFKIAYETSVSAGIRRIEALTGEAALSQFQAASRRLHEVAAALHVGDAELVPQIERNRARQAELEAELERLRLRAAQAQSAGGNRLRQVAGVTVLTARADQMARPQLRNFLDELRSKSGAEVIVLGGVHEGKAALIIAVAPALSGRLPAGSLLKALPEATGGGRAEMAEGGTKDPARLDAILDGAYGAVERLLSV